jgi:hypothetical protein
VVSVRTGFETYRHGFPFPNAFAPGTPVVQVPTPWGAIGIGDLSRGLCGGMVFAALDAFHHRRPVATSLLDQPDLLHYVRLRLWNSFNGLLGVGRIYAWTCRPDRTVRRLTAEREWPRLMARMTADRQPMPLMLIRVQSRSPWELGHNHQVLATGFDYHPDTGRAVVHLYEPNYPTRDAAEPPVTLSFNTRDTEGQWVEHSREGLTVRGFFLNPYRVKQPPGS